MRGASRVIDSSTVGKTLHKQCLYKRLDVDTNDLSKAEQDALNDYLDETGRNGVWLANRYGDEFREMLKPSCQVGSLGAGDFGGGSLGSDKFHSVGGPQATMTAGSCGPDIDGLDADGARRIRDLQNRGVLDDDDVRQLLRVIDEGEDIGSEDVRTTLKRVEMVGEKHEIKKFMTADEANGEYVARKKADGEDNPQPPHEENSIIIEYETQEKQVLYRLWDTEHPDSNMMGEWATTDTVVSNADEFKELNDALAAPDKFNYNKIARVEIDDGTTLRMSTAGEVKDWDRDGGAVQVMLRDRVPSSNWTPLEDLSEVGS